MINGNSIIQINLEEHALKRRVKMRAKKQLEWRRPGRRARQSGRSSQCDTAGTRYGGHDLLGDRDVEGDDSREAARRTCCMKRSRQT